MASATLRKHDVDMTVGAIFPHLLRFALPLMLGNAFQQLYNTVDSVVVGNFVSKQALAAVGTLGPVINTLVGFFSGFSVGVSVIVSQRYGAHDAKGVHDAVHTSLLAVLIMSVFFTGIGVALVNPMLRIVNTPEDVFPESYRYLTIFFSGISGMMIYNIGAGILRAVGDSRRPLYFLIFSALVNTVLDLLFVIRFHMGVAGVAWATVIAQFLSAILILLVLMRAKESPYGLRLRDLRIDKRILRRVIELGLPTALQQAITSFSNMFVQADINQFGSACMAGWSSYGKLDQFALLPLTSISAAGTTFVGQNVGAGQVSRAKKGIRTTILMSLCSVGVLLTPLMLFAPQLTSLFNSDPEVIYYGTLFIRMISPFYLLVCLYDSEVGALRGVGESRVPMILLLTGFVVIRQIYLFIITHTVNTIEAVAMGYPLGWMFCAIAIGLYFKFGKWEQRLLNIPSPKQE